MLFSSVGYVIYAIYDRERIHHAASVGDVAQVQQILSRTPDRLEHRDRRGLTPLHIATWEGQSDVLNTLIIHGADVNAKWNQVATGDGDWNALHIAGIRGQVEAAKLLIRSGTQINHSSIKGETPLDIAVGNGKRELAEFLRASGGVNRKPG